MIKVCDAIMGTGKSSAAINYMNEHPNEKFLYITPFLEEAERIKKGCPDLHFIEPSDKIKKYNFKKTEHIAALIKNGRNITTTHQAFKRYDPELLDVIKSSKYHLIIDENMDILELYNYHPDDIDIAIHSGLVKEEDGYIKLSDEDYKGELFKELCKFLRTRDLLRFKDKNVDALFYWILPPELLQSFDEVIILTYLFEGQSLHHFLKMYNIPFQYIGVEKYGDYYSFSETSCYVPEYVKCIKEKIHICDNIKMNLIGRDFYALSKNWYLDDKNNNLKEALRKHLSNYMNNIYRGVDKDMKLWSCFVEHKNKVKGKGYINSFLVFNSKSTNQYKDRTHLAYLVNLFMNTNEKVYYHRHGIKVDEEKYALSIMVQWIWRSAIREGKDIYLYIPSRRMREILINWMDSLEKGVNEIREEEM